MNPGEIPNNGVDDDGNGYVDDVHGWDFADDDNDPSDEDRVRLNPLRYGSRLFQLSALRSP